MYQKITQVNKKEGEEREMYLLYRYSMVHAYAERASTFIDDVINFMMRYRLSSL